MKRRLSFLVATILFVSVLFFVECNTNSKKNSVEEEVFKIGVIIPLTGNSSAIGNIHKQGIDLAISEINKNRNGKKAIEAVYEDSKNESKTGLAAFNKLRNVDNIPVILSTFSNVCVPLASTMKTQQINDVVLLSTATSAPNITIGSEYVFRSFITSNVESAEIARFITEDLGYSKTAIYYVQDDYGKGAADVFFDLYTKKYNNNVVFKEAFDINQIDHKNSIFKIKKEKPEIIFLTGYGQSLVSAINQIRETDIKCDIICTATLALPDAFNNLGEAKEGIYLTSSLYDESSTLKDYQSFKEEFIKMFPESKDNYQSASTYLCTKIITEAIDKKGYSADKIKEGLLSITQFNTPLGGITFNNVGEASFPVKIKVIKNGNIVNIEKE
ncbi:MAG: ABC transporter substrate-binding protein [Bacteroidales bacterium]|nr:ABC transporter substrate-binding protein [Bacteroidales bacterium]